MIGLLLAWLPSVLTAIAILAIACLLALPGLLLLLLLWMRWAAREVPMALVAFAASTGIAGGGLVLPVNVGILAVYGPIRGCDTSAGERFGFNFPVLGASLAPAAASLLVGAGAAWVVAAGGTAGGPAGLRMAVRVAIFAWLWTILCCAVTAGVGLTVIADTLDDGFHCYRMR